MNKRTRLAIAGLLIGSVAFASADAFIFRRMRLDDLLPQGEG